MRNVLILTTLLLSVSARAEVDVFPFQIVIACAPESDGLRDVLSRAYGEAVILQGAMSDGTGVEIWSAADGSSWTITAALPDGGLCVLAGGSELQAVPWKAPGERT